LMRRRGLKPERPPKKRPGNIR